MRWAFSALLAFVVVCTAAPVSILAQPGNASENPLFTVANFEVWGEARDAVAAKKAALGDGRSVALSLLMRRLTLFDAKVKLPEPDPLEVSGLIASLSVRNERNSKTEYLAKLDFQFSEQGVKKLLLRARIPYLDKQAPKVKLIPIVDTTLLGVAGASQQNVISEKNWRESWQTLDLAHGMAPIEVVDRLPVIDSSVLAALSNSDEKALVGLKEAYGNGPVVVALISASATPGKIALMIAGFDGVGEIVLKREYAASGGDMLQTADFAAEVAFATLEARWKITQMRPRVKVAVREVLPWDTKMQEAAPVTGWESNQLGSRFEMRVKFSGLRHWQSIRQRIADIDGVDQLNIDQLSARGARISCIFAGELPVLQSELAEKNLFLEQAGGVWTLRDG